MIKDDQELEATLERIRHFQAQLAHLRKMETNPVNYRLSASGCSLTQSLPFRLEFDDDAS